jgi:hypothetical protein
MLVLVLKPELTWPTSMLKMRRGPMIPEPGIMLVYFFEADMIE